MTKYFIIIISFFIVTSCAEDKKVTLGNGFYYEPFQENIFDATTFSGNGIFKYQNFKRIPTILPKINSFKYDVNYVIVEQYLDINQSKVLLQSILSMPNLYFSFNKSFLPINEIYFMDENLENDSFSIIENRINIIFDNDIYLKKLQLKKTNYFIIDKKFNKIYFSSSKIEFEKQKKNLGVKLVF